MANDGQARQWPKPLMSSKKKIIVIRTYHYLSNGQAYVMFVVRRRLSSSVTNVLWLNGKS